MVDMDKGSLPEKSNIHRKRSDEWLGMVGLAAKTTQLMSATGHDGFPHTPAVNIGAGRRICANLLRPVRDGWLMPKGR